MVKSLAERDPWQAYDWLRENGGTTWSRYAGRQNLMPSFIALINRQDPAMLGRLAESTPPGELRRQIDAVLFKNLLEQDPLKAVQAARETGSPVTAAWRLADAGSALALRDPEQAFAVAGDLRKFLEEPPSPGPNLNVTEDERARQQAVREFTSQLMGLDPARTLKLLDEPGTAELHERLAQNWAGKDSEAYAKWLGQEPDPAARQKAMLPLISALEGGQRYAEAAQWALQLDNAGQRLDAVLNSWRRRDPQAARAWAQAQGPQLAEPVRKEIESHLR